MTSSVLRAAACLLVASALAACTPDVAPEVTDGPVTPGPTPAPTPAPSVDPVQELAAALEGTVWHGHAEIDGVERMLEHHFRGTTRTQVVNPFGPSSHHADVALDPEAVELFNGLLFLEIDGQRIEFEAGPAPIPTEGFTANARVFEPGGAVDEAFCDSGIWGFDYDVLLPFARGVGSEAPLAHDVVAGAPLTEWADPGDNRFAVADVPGFDRDGGTELDDRYNFVVTYRGTLDHPGGTLQFREADDDVEDGIWVFLGEHAGTGTADDAHLAVNGFYWFDGTEAEPTADLPAGPVEIEVIVMRCTETITPVTLEYAINGSIWRTLDRLDVRPPIHTDDFPGAR